MAIILTSNLLYSQCIIHEYQREQTSDFVTTDDDGPSIYDGDVVTINNTLFFAATDGINGTELWKIDGITNELVFIKDIHPGSLGSRPSEYTELDGNLIFRATSELGAEL